MYRKNVQSCPQGINYTFKKRQLIKQKRHTPEWFSGAWRIRMVKKFNQYGLEIMLEK